jgi:hypothetical protein
VLTNLSLLQGEDIPAHEGPSVDLSSAAFDGDSPHVRIYRVPDVMPVTSAFNGTRGISQFCTVKCLLPYMLAFKLSLRANLKGRSVQFEVLIAGTPSPPQVFSLHHG